MVHSIELLFDRDTEAAIRALWADLAAAPIAGRAPAGRPHVTLIAAERIAPEVDALLRPVSQRLPLGCAVGASVLFGRSGAVLARLIVPTAGLLALHAEVHLVSGPYLTAAMPNSLPDKWTAHVTLARRIGEPHVGQAVRIAGRPAELRGSLAGLRRWDGNQRTEQVIN
ncbi:MAG: 2'-5' RNA ligase family protein [Mycobacterium sp.]|nr:2'-5' RNA ligase family protein [Mycobacterium sp.]